MSDECGVSALEFALVGPLAAFFLIAVIEFALVMAAYVVLNLAASEASRVGLTGRVDADTTRSAMITATIARYASGLIDPDQLHVTTEVYEQFADTAAAEPFRDANGNGTHDEVEWYKDVNGNGEWDDHVTGTAGLGGPDAIVLYTLTYDWHFITPLLPRLIGNDAPLHLRASIAVRNEPFPDGL